MIAISYRVRQEDEGPSKTQKKSRRQVQPSKHPRKIRRQVQPSKRQRRRRLL